MKTKRFLGLVLVPAFLACGCASMNNTEKGLLAGGGIGAATGALIGNATGNTGAGAAIGTMVGGLAGGLTGSAIDEQDRKNEARVAAVAAQQEAERMGMTDVINLTRNHTNDQIIINQIRTSHAVFHLSAADILTLKANGVSDAVVAEMQATAQRYPRHVYQRAPATHIHPVYVMDPAPPPVSVGFGVGYYGGCRRW